ncbi:bifunctional (p)ppGpp synthetase/guanosine-3',5'-bis(diphosphate) 3'-pyrophosphohydrolase [Candidatus Woesebacteria bacterium]|nr:bifunctional (p)ppGpp synthetase/guanosine-3',5'-bis(diphosphate) 3'-pyrophosphohydrolase [Candidatus Woesebacteria bacterium]
MERKQKFGAENKGHKNNSTCLAGRQVIQTMEEEFQKLILEIKGYNPNANIELITKAWEFAKLAHTGQKRFSGEDYIIHPLKVAKRLADWKLDTTSIVAGFLHDTVEDGGAKREDLIKEFGEEVTQLVDGVTKVTNLRLKGSYEEEFIENLRKMILYMARDLRVVLVKLADRLHNMETLLFLAPQAQKENSQETLEIYAPLAERLGMGEIKGQLEDLAFPYAYPTEYNKVLQDSRPHYKKAEKYIKEMKRVLLIKLAKEGIKAEVHGRKKHLFSLWRKLERPGVDWQFDKVADIIALRILVDTISDCYGALGVVHNTYKPVPRFGTFPGLSDFIAQPKPNGYRSIHTKVFGPSGGMVEVQIRTHEMHEQAEYGIAAHWAYSEIKGKSILHDEILSKKDVVAFPNKLSWVKELVSWQKEIADSEEFLEAVKFDALSHRNFVFSPKGDVYDLPKDATPIDFAYAVHTGLGDFIKQAKVNGKIAPLDYKLKSGEIVEIIKSKKPRSPSRDWLKFVVTNTARKEIKKVVKG